MLDLRNIYKQQSDTLEKTLALQTEIEFHKAKEELLSYKLQIADEKLSEIQSQITVYEEKIKNLLLLQIKSYYGIIEAFTQANNKLLQSKYSENYYNLSMQLKLVQGYIQDIHCKIHKEPCRNCKKPLNICEFCDSL